MDLTRTSVFDLAEQRLSWLEARQQTLARNIANANTPGYQPRDLPSFASALARGGAASPARTRPNHLAGTRGGPLQPATVARPPERGPDGNAVAIDDELMKVADTETNQELVTNLYTKYMGFFRTALGKGQ